MSVQLLFTVIPLCVQKEKEIADLKEELDRKEDTQMQKEKEIADLKEKLDRKEDTQMQKEKEMADLKEVLQRKDEEIKVRM